MMQNILFSYLKTNPIFTALEPYMFQTVERYLSFRELADGEALFHEGETANYLAFVLIGNLQLVQHQSVMPRLNRTQVGAVKAGENTDETALLIAGTRQASAIASELTAVVTLSKADFDLIIVDYPRIGAVILRGIATLMGHRLQQCCGRDI